MANNPGSYIMKSIHLNCIIIRNTLNQEMVVQLHCGSFLLFLLRTI